jgi:exodeoxyribonuclease V alpha subunit
MQDSDRGLETLEGDIERLTYSNEETGFAVLRVQIGPGEKVTVVGNLSSVSPGERVRMQGQWVTHPRFGRQFRAEHYTSVQPTSASAIEKYLASGIIRGIGPGLAKKFVGRFGIETLDIIDKDIGRLAEIPGIGKKTIQKITGAWAAQKRVKEIMLFLVGHGIGLAHANKIYRHYGDRAVSVLQSNPYRLVEDIRGIGFLTADRIAGGLGIGRDSTPRIRAGLLHVLQTFTDEGNTHCPYDTLLLRGEELLQIGREDLSKGIAELFEEKKIIIEDLNENLEEMKENFKAVYPVYLYAAESGIAKGIDRLLSTAAPRALPGVGEESIRRTERAMGILFSGRQREAVLASVSEKILVVTGGPGTGKTTLIRAVKENSRSTHARVLLAAPTGRAAKRLSEITGGEARTIHRLLEFNPQRMEFTRDRERPLECDLLIVDEASMIDTFLLFALVRAIPDSASLVLVGDVDQLPSVGPGNVLKDLIGSGRVKVISLDAIFRQAERSLIVRNAHLVRQGRYPLLPKYPRGEKGDFYFIREKDPERIVELVLELAGRRIPESFGLRPELDIQVLVPLYRGTVGADNLNVRLQECLNPDGAPFQVAGKTFRVGDRVMQLRNNYEKEVFNGDIGKIVSSHSVNGEVVVEFYGSRVEYAPEETEDLVLAYAVSVHKSQGSEYPAVILPLVPQHFILLQRNLLYTAFTRAKRLLVVVGSERAIGTAVRNDAVSRRFTGLQWRLWKGGRP